MLAGRWFCCVFPRAKLSFVCVLLRLIQASGELYLVSSGREIGAFGG
jgi:hypothetical protein